MCSMNTETLHAPCTIVYNTNIFDKCDPGQRRGWRLWMLLTVIVSSVSVRIFSISFSWKKKTYHTTRSNPAIVRIQIFSTANCKDGLSNIWDNTRLFGFCVSDICLQVSTSICKASCSNKRILKQSYSVETKPYPSLCIFALNEMKCELNFK